MKRGVKMRFIHIADIHLGADPYIGSSRKEKREKEIWTSLERVLEVCESKHVEMLLIAGDLFHRQPLRRELKELDYLFSKLTMINHVLVDFFLLVGLALFRLPLVGLEPEKHRNFNFSGNF